MTRACSGPWCRSAARRRTASPSKPSQASDITGVGRNFDPPSGGDLAAFSIPILVPLVILAVPLLDVVLAIFRRVRRGRPVTHADKEHIHHRLMDFGHSHRKAVLLMYLWSALISGSALAVALIDGRQLVGGIAAAAMLIIVATAIPLAWPGIRAARRTVGDEEAEGEDLAAAAEAPALQAPSPQATAPQATAPKVPQARSGADDAGPAPETS